LENFLLIIIIGILLLYFFSSANVYKSLYKKVNEEKNLLNEEIKKQKEIISKYEKQVKINAGALKGSQENLDVARNDLQELRLENMDMKHKLENIEKRNEELYAQVNTMV
jgi:septal ring factor EnvC (AmiA/AmiB activator)